MKKFQFPYQKLMEWRDRQAEEERNKLEQLHASRHRLEREREALAADIGSSHAAFSSPTTSSAEDLRHLAAFVGALRTREQSAQIRTVECQQRIDVQLQRCVSADRNHELLARMRERQATSWQYEFDRETEQGATDSWLSGHARSLARASSEES